MANHERFLHMRTADYESWKRVMRTADYESWKRVTRTQDGELRHLDWVEGEYPNHVKVRVSLVDISARIYLLAEWFEPNGGRIDLSATRDMSLVFTLLAGGESFSVQLVPYLD